MDEFRTLYIDMNSFFASVEQHMRPELRGRPVGITAIDAGAGACVAASVEAKRFGVRTGTPVREARRLCPSIVLLPSRHRLYVRFNLHVGAIFDRMAELERIRSVDEFQIRLWGEATELEGAAQLVQAMRDAVRREIGPAIRFSAGIGPNHLLAKIAGKLEKPDGFQWLSPRNMPDRIAHLALDDLPGISKGIRAKLYRACIWDVPALHALDPRHARRIWRSVEGERFVRALQGMDFPLGETSRHGYGNSKVLSPAFRPVREAYLVGRWLVEKAAARLRRDGRVAARLSLDLSLDEAGWRGSVRCAPLQDTLTFLALHRDLWQRAWRERRPQQVFALSIHLGDVTLLSARSGDLLIPLAPAEPSRGERVSAVADLINRRFGADTIRFGINAPHHGFFERG
ncbi:MAG: UMUC-like DNA-repair protein [Sphingomonadaceae bacterium]|nr:UMUC-like DNA-repair protein [Sphingomonadaceae bacterium]